MKSIVRTLLLVVGILLVLILGYGGAVWVGWLPIPRLVTDQVARMKHLSPQQAEALGRVANLWGTLKSSADASVVDQAVALAGQHPAPADWWKFAQSHWSQLHPETLNRIQQQLGVSDDDFAQAQALVQRAVDRFAKNATTDLPDADRALLDRLDEKYHLIELIGQLK